MARRLPALAATAIVLAACDFGLSGLSGGPEVDAGADATAPGDAAPPPPVPPPSPLDAGDADSDASTPPPSFVQATATSSPDASVATATFEAGVTPGNAIVVAFDYDVGGGAPLTVNDTQNDSFTNVIDWVGSNGSHHAVSAALAVAGGPTNVTAQITSPTKQIELYLHEYAGVGAIGESAGANGTSLAVDGMQTPLVTTTAPSTLLFGYGICGTCVAGTGFAQRSTFHDNFTEDRVATTPGAYRGTGTMTQGSGWSMIVVALAPK